jgi:hypothetical protein
MTIGAAVPALLRAEGYEHTPAAHPSVWLFRRVFMLKAASTRPVLIGGQWWREDWTLVQADVHD